LGDKELRAEHREWAIGLLFPAVVGGGGLWLNNQAERRSEKVKNEEREQSELKDYFDRISTLVVESGLTKSDEESDQYQIARALTANILRELTEKRMNQVMFFLGSLGLLGRPIETKEESPESENEQLKRSLSLLRGIDLNNAELQGLKGWKTDLGRASLNGANLSGASLNEANLNGANLINANLSEADLNGVNLINANLNGANLNEADLGRADLFGAKLFGAELFGANFNEAQLWYADLNEADFTGANLIEVNFNEANFTGAILENTNLSEHLTEEQQKQCKVYDPIIVESEV